MKKLFLILTFGIFVGFVSSCATVMRENNQSIPIRANVEDVQIKIMDKKGKVVFEGTTPTTINLKTSAGGYFDPQKHEILASKDGFKTQSSIIDWHVSGWYYAGNLVIGGKNRLFDS